MIPVFDLIADELAKNSYAIADQFLSPAEVSAIVELDDFKNSTSNFRKAGIGKLQGFQINEGIRGDYIRWVDKTTAAPEIQVYLARIQALMDYLNQTLFLSLKDFEVHMTRYPAGAYYKRHLDQFTKYDHRKLSVICYLNQAWQQEDGGQLRIHLDKGPLDVLPVCGKLVCFRSDSLEHEVLPAARERLSLTGWILDQHVDLKHL